MEPVKAPARLGGRHVSKVVASPFYDDIVELLRSRWSPRSIERYLRLLYAEYPELLEAIPGHKAIERWRNRHLPDADILPESLLQKRLQGVDVKVNVFGLLSSLVPMLTERLGRALETEEKLTGFLMPTVDQASHTLLSVLGKVWEVGQDLGIHPSRPPAPPVIHNQVYVGSGAPEPSDEEVLVAFRAIYQSRRGRPPPRLAAPARRHQAQE
jgi:hypothetical protein